MSNADREHWNELFPHVLDGDHEETAEALDGLASVMGCLLATVRVRGGEQAYRDTLARLSPAIEASAERALALANDAGPNFIVQ